MAPPPRKPTPTTTCDATRVTSIWTFESARTDSNGANACTEISPNKAAPRHSRMWVRNPAGWASISRSMPSAPPSATASMTRRTSTQFSSSSRWTFISPGSPSGTELLERRPRQQQPLLADVPKPHDGFRPLTFPDQVDDHSFAERLVVDVVADAEGGHLVAPRVARERG